MWRAPIVRVGLGVNLSRAAFQSVKFLGETGLRIFAPARRLPSVAAAALMDAGGDVELEPK